jgi:hypothetical protein
MREYMLYVQQQGILGSCDCLRQRVSLVWLTQSLDRPDTPVRPTPCSSLGQQKQAMQQWLAGNKESVPCRPITALLQVGLETLCVIICSLMLVSVFKTGKRYVSDEEEAEFMARCRDFIRDYRCGQHRDRLVGGWWDRLPHCDACSSCWARAGSELVPQAHSPTHCVGSSTLQRSIIQS